MTVCPFVNVGTSAVSIVVCPTVVYVCNDLYVNMCACTACWDKQVSLRPNRCVFQQGGGGTSRLPGNQVCVSLMLHRSLCLLSFSLSVCSSQEPYIYISFWNIRTLFFIEIQPFLLQAPTFVAVGALWLSGCSSWYWRSSAPHCCLLQWCPLCTRSQVWVHPLPSYLFFLIVWTSQYILVF